MEIYGTHPNTSHVRVMMYILQFISYRDENLASNARVVDQLSRIMGDEVNIGDEGIQRAVFLNLVIF